MIQPGTGAPAIAGGVAVMDGAEAAVSPVPEANEVDAVGQRSRKEIASRVFQAHVNGLRATRDRDLISEKLLLHIDGSGDFQWADILNGVRVEIPRLISEFRKTENLLRPIIDNAIAHHTTMPFRFHADSTPDRRARDQATVDGLWINHLSEEQDWRALFADSLSLAMPAGFCPAHAYWREDQHHFWQAPVGPVVDDGMQAGGDPFEALLEEFMPGRGTIDCWLGNPFDTVFDPGATKNNIRWCSYGRILPAGLVRDHFDHVPEARSLEGSTRVPSAAEFHRIARSWRHGGLGLHGSPIADVRRGGESDDELMTVVVRETAPGVDMEHPDGRLQIVAVPGEVDTRKGEGQGSHAVLLADQPLPGGDMSFSIFYSHNRGSDVRGKPWAEELDQLQVDLNIGLSKRWEFLQKLIDAPIVAPGGAISDDMMDLNGYGLLEVEPSLAGWRPRVMEWSQSVLPALEKEIEDKRRAMYTIGGYQASSRGESPGSRTPYRAIVALQQADQSVHGPVNQRFQRSACDFARRCWKQFKAYGDVPWLVKRMGDEYSHLADPYISNTQLSEEPPHFRMVNAFGTSPEMRAQEVVELATTQGADGEPILSTEEARRLHPDHSLFGQQVNAKAVRRRRARTVAKAIVEKADDFREQHQFQEQGMGNPWVQQAAMKVFAEVEKEFPRMRDDDLDHHIEALSEVTQDETADAIARVAAQQRQELYYQWQEMMAGAHLQPQMQQGQQAQAAGAGPGGGAGPGAPDVDRRAVAAETGGRGGPGVGTTLSDAGTGEARA